MKIENPLLDKSDELLNLISNKVTNSDDGNILESKGKGQFDDFMQNLQKCHNPMKHYDLKIFENQISKKKNTKNLKKDCTLFSSLFIICKNCDLDLNEFFKFKN